MTQTLSRHIGALRSADREERRAAAEALAGLGSEARGAAVALVAASCDADESVRQWSSSALEDLGPPCQQDQQPLIRLLDDRRADVAYWAATLLGRLGDRATDAVDALALTVMASPFPAVRQRAAWALGHIGPPAAAATPALTCASRSDNTRLSRLAARALASIRG